MTPIFCCGWECGATFQSHFQNIGAGATWQTTTVRNGTYAGRINITATNNYFQHILASAANSIVMRMAIRFATVPSADCELASVVIGGTTRCGAFFKNSDSKIYAGKGVSSLGATGVAVTTGTWYYVDVSVDASANPWTIDVKVNGAACGQVTQASAAATGSNLDIGAAITSVTGDWFYDDFVVSTTAGDYPIGDGKVLPSSPNRDGTHTAAGTNFVKGAAGTAITVTSTDVWMLLDDIPLAVNTSDWVNQQTSTPTQYVEVLFASATSSDGPRAVEMLVAAHNLTTAAAHSRWELNDNGTTALVWNRAVSGTSGLQTQTIQFATMPGGGASWSLARYNGIALRFGYSTDATPDVFFDAALLEAEWAASAVGTTIAITVTGLGSLAFDVTLRIPITAAL